MTVTLDLSPEVERGLLAQAEARGLSLSEYLQEIATREAVRSIPPASGEEKAKAFRKWVKSFPDTPPLSAETISRASLYPDRW